MIQKNLAHSKDFLHFLINISEFLNSAQILVVILAIFDPIQQMLPQEIAL